jgi:thiamine-monophosphate kinase
MKTVGELGEDGLIAQLCGGLSVSGKVVVGPGDDCAVVGEGDLLTLLKADAVVAGVHFLAGEDPRRVGWKAVARVLSDFAAMGGTPGELLVTIALENKTPVDWVIRLYEGMTKCLDQHGGVIVGGETTSLPEGAPAMISVAGRGTVKSSEVVTRSGGRPGNAIYVTGTLGGSIRGKHLDFTPRLEEANWLTRHFKINAMMDLSDGLAKDLPRLARMSGCGFEIDRESLPLSEGISVEEALGDGEDYELLFTSGDEIEGTWGTTFPDLRLTKVGQLVLGKGSPLEGGWDHFNR